MLPVFGWFLYSDTVGIRLFDTSNNWMAKNSLIAKWSVNWMVILNRYSNVRFVSGCQIVRCLNDGPKTGMKKKPVYGPKCQLFKWLAKSYGTIWIQDAFSVLYSDESGIQMSGNPVTVRPLSHVTCAIWFFFLKIFFFVHQESFGGCGYHLAWQGGFSSWSDWWKGDDQGRPVLHWNQVHLKVKAFCSISKRLQWGFE